MSRGSHGSAGGICNPTTADSQHEIYPGYYLRAVILVCQGSRCQTLPKAVLEGEPHERHGALESAQEQTAEKRKERA